MFGCDFFRKYTDTQIRIGRLSLVFLRKRRKTRITDLLFSYLLIIFCSVKGDEYATPMNLYNLSFRMVSFFIFYGIYKMATDRGGGEDFNRGYWSWVKYPHLSHLFFYVKIDLYEFV